jgi:hypothetical protein
MSSFLRYLVADCIFLVGLSTPLISAAPQGFIEGQLKILAYRPVQLADENVASAAARNYADYPLIILSQREKKQIARITASRDGTFHAALPPGNYKLDVQGRVTRRLRVITEPFTVVPNKTVRVDMAILTGLTDE